MDQVCIICRIKKLKSAFNKEHIFPASIGEQFTISSICKSCNQQLGQSVDRPFLAHPLIGIHRKIYNLSRDKRNILNPLYNINRNKDIPFTISFKKKRF